MDERLTMENVVKHIRFPFTFDVVKLQQEVQTILAQKWINHYNTNDYEGEWASIALLSQGGKSENINALNIGNEKVSYTEITLSCIYLKELIDSFLFEKTTVRLLRLAAGAYIKPHTDHCLGYEDGVFRIHIPVITNPNVEFILDEERLIMKEGECWYIDANFTHSVANKGKKDRIHLVIDGIRNEWTDTLFFNEANPKQFIKPEPQLSLAEKKLLIAQLKTIQTPIAEELIKKIKKEIE
ncbi:aspartyl/asparaginyl beta-hydroxylase domain-containing protein [Flavobacterium sp. J27]|uniref:aspartyl/asparaginyl beta-hydroxylase domain-containing protein n=1 Tax=Flavobacterium sp. J27 TaxID=2060419 RepID=UPI001F0ECB3D|nr:aspartyl/asparaginyl beta-hydroxylase domain-containing protein [Flavobacterium sp. J27]